MGKYLITLDISKKGARKALCLSAKLYSYVGIVKLGVNIICLKWVLHGEKIREVFYANIDPR